MNLVFISKMPLKPLDTCVVCYLENNSSEKLLMFSCYIVTLEKGGEELNEEKKN